MPDAFRLLHDVRDIVRQAGTRALAMQPGTTRKIKEDGSIVTPADSEIEVMLRTELARLLPGAGIQGEELGSSAEGEDGLWCIDPIDGTSNYAFGSPLWGVSVGLVKGERALLGVVYIPALDEMYAAVESGGATLNGRPMAPIAPGAIRPEELVSYPDRVLFRYSDAELPGKMRHTGAFVVDATFTAAQRFRALIGIREKLYDIAACLCIAREVGADVRYADGAPLEIEPLKDPAKKIVKGWVIAPPNSGLQLTA